MTADPTPPNLDALVALLPLIESEGFVAGTPAGGEKQPDGSMTFPYCNYSPIAARLMRAIYDEHLLIKFNWPEWQPTAERIFSDPTLIASADLDTCRKLLTLRVRKDRFCEGHFAQMIESGHIAVILRRIRDLRDTAAGTAG